MNIAVISPHTHANGNTTVAAMLAAELSSRNKKVCLTHVKSKSDSLCSYFGFTETSKDKTSNPMQLVNLIREGGIRKDEIGIYCREITERLDLFTVDTNNFENEGTCVDEEQMNVVLKFISSSFPHDYVIFDVDENNLEHPNVKAVLDNTDCLIFVLSQSISELRRFAAQKEKINRYVGKIPQLVVINKYSDIVGDIKTTAAMIGIKKPGKWYPVRINQWIPYCENRGQFKYLMAQMQSRSAEVVDLDSDIKHLVGGIQNVKKVMREVKRQERGY